ncbi:hypothetical protein BpHYR1_033686 [Brachionus plicatilis]|uniref:Uncharacterized protein n=1 Tax=Brachionus plicatilis TaxID=10195 RepID=A0A3M7Q8W5_BRAPC|nr:hypothetical protein BpHYR1_033686 [Brachionus plicatilis]
MGNVTLGPLARSLVANRAVVGRHDRWFFLVRVIYTEIAQHLRGPLGLRLLMHSVDKARSLSYMSLIRFMLMLLTDGKAFVAVLLTLDTRQWIGIESVVGIGLGVGGVEHFYVHVRFA